MKRFIFKQLLILVLVFCFMPFSVFAASESAGGFYDSFTEYIWFLSLKGYKTSTAAGSIKTTSYTDKNGNNGIALCMNDTYGGDNYSGVSIKKSFDTGSKNSVMFKMKFMVEKTEDLYGGLRFGLTKGSNFVTRYDVLGLSGSYNGRLYSIDAKNAATPLGWEKLVPKEWYTLTAVLNVEDGSHSVKVESDSMAVPFYSSFVPLTVSGNDFSVDGIHIETNQYTGKCYIEYIDVKADDNLDIGEKPRPEPIPAPITQAPYMRPVPYRNNVCVNGEYQYFTDNPIIEDDDLVVSVAGAFRALDLIPVSGGDGLVAQTENYTVALKNNSNELRLNNNTLILETKVRELDDKPHIAIGNMAELMGFEVSWNSEEKILYIDGEIVENEYTQHNSVTSFSNVEFVDAGEKIQAKAMLKNTSSEKAMGTLFVASYLNGNMISVKSAQSKELVPGAEDVVIAEVEKTNGAEYKAFAWHKNEFYPVASAASTAFSGELLADITIDGVSMSEYEYGTQTFDAAKNAYAFEIPGGSVVPVVKGVANPDENSIYTKTIYSVNGNTAVATVTARSGSNEKIYTLNFSASKALVPHISDFVNHVGNKTWTQFWAYNHGKAESEAPAEPTKDVYGPAGGTSQIPGNVGQFGATFSQFENSISDTTNGKLYNGPSAAKQFVLEDISDISGLADGYYLQQSCYFNPWFGSYADWVYDAFWMPSNNKETAWKPWYTFKVNAPCEVKILFDNSYDTVGFCEEYGWTRCDLSESLYTGGRWQTDAYTSGYNNTLMYTKKFNAGDTVELYSMYNSTVRANLGINGALAYLTIVDF